MKVLIGPYPTYKRGKKTPKRKVSIRIDKFDTWSMDSTLAMLIVPMLKQLKATTHGAPMVDSGEDVPRNLRPTAKQLERFNKDGHTDPKFFKRWEYILDEMIWAFSQVNAEWEQKFVSGKADNLWQALDKDGKEIGKPVRLESKKEIKGAHSYRMVKGPKDTYKIDYKGRQAHWDRMKNGFRLFGKYYSNLWD